MSHNVQQGTIYIDTNTNPDTGVSIGDVKTILGETSNDLGTLCKSSHINPMARFKPVEYNTWGVTGKTSGSQYWKAYNGQCGIDIPKSYWTDADWAWDFRRFISNDVAWGREEPRTKYRLLDFDGYNATQTVSLSPTTIPTGALAERNQSSLMFEEGIPCFHVDLNAQYPGSNTDAPFLRASDIDVYSNQYDHCHLTDMYLKLILASDDYTDTIELTGDDWHKAANSNTLVQYTLGELINNGVTRVTFATTHLLTIETNHPIVNTPNVGDIYTLGSGNDQSVFKILEFVTTNNTITHIRVIRTSGTAFIDARGVLTRQSGQTGNGDSSIYYNDRLSDKYTFAGRSFKVLPILCYPTTPAGTSIMCSLGQNPSTINLFSITGVLETSGIWITKDETGDNGKHGSFQVDLDILSGFSDDNHSITYQITVYADNNLSRVEIDPTDANFNPDFKQTLPETVSTVPALVTTHKVFKRSYNLDAYQYTGLYITVSAGGTAASAYEVFDRDENEEPRSSLDS